MRQLLAVSSVACALSVAALAEIGQVGQAQWAPDVYGGYPTTHVVVQVRPGVAPAEAGGGVFFGDQRVDSVLATFGVTSVSPVVAFEFANPQLAAQIGLDRYYLVNTPQGTDVRMLAAQLVRFNGMFEKVELDGIGGTADTIPNDPAFNNLWGMHNTGAAYSCGGTGKIDADIDAIQAWDLWTGQDNITLAVIDSGVQNHVDFGSKVLVGWNTVTNNNSVSDADCPHGTHCAGTAGAIGDNGVGVAGVSWGVKILPVKVLTGCSGNETDCGEGIIWAADNGANVGTMSLQYYTGISFFQDAVAYGHQQGMVLIAATGNNQGNNVAYPAKFPFTVGVGATTINDTIAGFSNFGAEVDVSAPGQDVWSTLQTNIYDCYSGTSMATPHVAGLACLLWSYNPGLSNDQVIQAIKDNVEDLGTPGWDQFFGLGRINAFNTLNTNSPGLNISVSGGIPQLIPPGTAGTFNVKVFETDDDTLVPGSALQHVSVDGGATFVTSALSPQGGGIYTATLPSANCDMDLVYYVSAEGTLSGLKTAPFGAPTNLFSSDIGVIVVDTIYTQGLNSGLPSGWTSNGLWNFGTPCSIGASCEGGQYAYYGNPSTCTFSTGSSPNSGTLTSNSISLPVVPSAGSLTLKFCYTLQTEQLSPYDAARVLVNGSPVGQVSESASSWSQAAFDLKSFNGQNVTIGFQFDTVDGVLNDFRGWQVDGISIEAAQLECVDAGCSGDLNADGLVDQLDLNLLLAAYNTCPGQAGYNAAAGGLAPGDPCVTQEDLNVLLSNFACGA